MTDVFLIPYENNTEKECIWQQLRPYKDNFLRVETVIYRTTIPDNNLNNSSGSISVKVYRVVLANERSSNKIEMILRLSFKTVLREEDVEMNCSMITSRLHIRLPPTSPSSTDLPGLPSAFKL